MGSAELSSNLNVVLNFSPQLYKRGISLGYPSNSCYLVVIQKNVGTDRPMPEIKASSYGLHIYMMLAYFLTCKIQGGCSSLTSDKCKFKSSSGAAMVSFQSNQHFITTGNERWWRT